MKTILLSGLLFALLVTGNAQSIKNRDLVFLLDVTDQELFQVIKSDIQLNLPVFFKNTQFANIAALERFTLHIAPITDSEELDISSASICIPRKGLSYSAENLLKDPKPLVSLLKSKIAEYEQLSMRQMQTTSILNVLLKSIIQTDPKSKDSWFVLFSDLLENNKYINLYKRIPEPADTPKILKQVDPYVLSKLKDEIDSGFEPHIVIIMKELPKSKVDSRKLKSFWQGILTACGFSDIQFVDNLSNSIEL